jgi:ABC-type nitrate/sulfonate/bicarbonate transport system substrate-binding protein
MVALGAGYFEAVDKAFHTTIETDNYASGTLAVTGFLGGKDQFTNSAQSEIAAPASEGRKIQVVYQEYSGSGIVLVGAAKYKTSRGSNTAAYNGATWCYTAPGSPGEVASIGAATKAGLNWADQKPISIGTTAAYLSTLASGQCAITAMDATNAAKAESEGIGYTVQNQNVAAIGKEIYGQSGLLIGSVIAASTDFVAKYPALTQAIVQAFVKANVYLQQHADNPAQIYSLLPQEFKSSNTETQFAYQWSLVGPSYTSSSGVISSASIALSEANERSQKILSAPVPPDTYNNTYVIEAYKALGLGTPPTDGSAVVDAK